MDAIALIFTSAYRSQSWSLSHSSSWLNTRLHIYIHFRRGFSSLPFSSSFYWLSSSGNSSKYSFKSYCPWLSNSSVASSVVTSYNPASCTSLLMSSTVFSTGSNPVKSCINSGRSLHHTPFGQFIDTSSQPVMMLLMPFNMSNERQLSLIVLSDLSKTQGLVEVIGFNRCYYSLVH